jgi:hypothetical protein
MGVGWVGEDGLRIWRYGVSGPSMVEDWRVGMDGFGCMGNKPSRACSDEEESRQGSVEGANMMGYLYIIPSVLKSFRI